MNKYNLDIPIYLNQKIVFDLLASINNGLAQVTKLKTSSTVGIEFSGGVDAELGNKNIFTLLGVNLKGKLENGKKIGSVLNFVSLLFNLIPEAGCGQSPQSLVNTRKYGIF